MAFAKLNGFYRGRVLEHMSDGMCKVFVYGVYPDEWQNSPEKLPPAEQASALFAGSNMGNGVFSYPNVGATVWCFFANGDQNYPVYFASTLGGKSASARWNEARSDCTGRNIASGDDAYVHKIDVNKTTVKLWESGYAEIVTRFPRPADDSAGDFSGDASAMGEDQGEDRAKIVLDGKGNVIVESTQRIHVSAPAVSVEAEDEIAVKAPAIRVSAGAVMEVTAPMYSNVNETSHGVTSPAINMNASKGMFAAKGKRHTTLVN